MKKFLLLFFLLIANQNFAQLNTHTFEEAEKLSKTSPKPFVIFLHTDWCNYCKMMENTTFKEQKIIAELNKNFYFISFNAEDKKAINFNNHAFKFLPKGNNSGIHELALSLGEKNGNLVYPTIAILDSDYSILTQIQSFTNSKILLEILQKLKR
ncbi:thioredoxin fold domain-containing protein [uncultured Flavobacterium sp.]|uniref:thioredoxin family protein n=1 Tax=uncultured Flavobacterium sp. TaxID=165435 RepID=UPI0025ED80E1|nr:thioredoxin fold domain-containing protein [uncultured Flavobacterium sp.]